MSGRNVELRSVQHTPRAHVSGVVAEGGSVLKKAWTCEAHRVRCIVGHERGSVDRLGATRPTHCSRLLLLLLGELQDGALSALLELL